LRGGERFAGVSVQYGLLQDKGYASAVARLFDTVTPENEMKWDVLHPERDRYDFGPADTIVDFARAHDLRVRGHTLVWHNQNPGWLLDGDFSRAQLIGILRDHIRTVLRHYRGKVAEWDVVNEAIDDDGKLRDTVWLRGIGPEYIPLAFRFAHEADPDAKLYYNDYGTERTGKKADAVYGLVAGLVRAKVPIDAVGFQTHVDAKPIPGYEATLRRFAALGLDVALTEVDVRLPAEGGDEDEQARAYERIAAGCVALPRCRGIVFWGLDDKDSWVPAAYPGAGAATLFDEDLRPKPAYAAVRRALRGG
jgi:endo-1,4-beta-xylanase